MRRLMKIRGRRGRPLKAEAGAAGALGFSLGRSSLKKKTNWACSLGR